MSLDLEGLGEKVAAKDALVAKLQAEKASIEGMHVHVLHIGDG